MERITKGESFRAVAY